MPLRFRKSFLSPLALASHFEQITTDVSRYSLICYTYALNEFLAARVLIAWSPQFCTDAFTSHFRRLARASIYLHLFGHGRRDHLPGLRCRSVLVRHLNLRGGGETQDGFIILTDNYYAILYVIKLLHLPFTL